MSSAVMRSPDSAPDTVGARARLASPRLAVALGGLAVGLVAASVPLSISTHDFATPLVAGALTLVFASTGVVVARREPRNPVGWILLGAGLLIMLCTFEAALYVEVDYRLHHGSWPLGWLAILANQLWAAPLMLGPIAILLFPAGNIPSPRWRWFLRAYVAAAAVMLASQLIIGLDAVTAGNVPVDSRGNLTASGPRLFSNPVVAVGGVLLVCFILACWIGFVGVQIASYRRSAGIRRQQLKWVMCGAAISAISIPLFIGWSNSSSPILQAVNFLAVWGLAALPVSIGIAILKHGLYEIDRLISRTLSYLILTGLLVGVFVGIVVLATRVLPFSSPVAVAASTLTAAALFNPMRGRVQRLVDRRFNRARYDAEVTIAALTAKLRDAVDLETVQAGLLDEVHQALAPTHASVWIRPPRP